MSDRFLILGASDLVGSQFGNEKAIRCLTYPADSGPNEQLDVCFGRRFFVK